MKKVYEAELHMCKDTNCSLKLGSVMAGFLVNHYDHFQQLSAGILKGFILGVTITELYPVLSYLRGLNLNYKII